MGPGPGRVGGQPGRGASWTSTGILGSTIPAAVSAGQAGGDGWSTAISILSSRDPHAVFSNPFLDQLLR